MELARIIRDFAAAFRAVDASKPRGSSRKREYRPGIGPLAEAEAISRALRFLQSGATSPYKDAGPRVYPDSRQQCDTVIPGLWAIEFKLIRPFGDNGVEAEHWSENILHPYSGNTSSIGDAIKLAHSGFTERKAIIVFGYEHIPPQIELTNAVSSFEMIAEGVVGIRLGKRTSADFGPLIHPVHQQGKIFGWEILGLDPAKSL